jgi:DNA polymerase
MGLRVPLERYLCVAAWARAHNMPGSLDRASKAYLPESKRKLSAKAAKWMWDANNPIEDKHLSEYLTGQVAYCERDVEAMRDLWRLMLNPSTEFVMDYHISERINDNGFKFDVDMIDAAVRLEPYVMQDAANELAAAVASVTPPNPDPNAKPIVVKLRGPSFLKWLIEQLPEDLKPILTVTRKRKKELRWWTEEKQSIDRTVRANLLEALESRTGVDHIRQALAAFDEANRAAVTKYGAARDRMSADGALRGSYILNGASTGRYSSVGLQVHNLIRDVPKNALDIIHDLKHPVGIVRRRLKDNGFSSINQALSRVIRACIHARLKKALVWCDLSAIEARVLPWLSDDPEAEKLLDLFRREEDVYVAAARDIFHTDVITEDQRRAGKVAVLALGFGGAHAALAAMAQGYGLKFTEDEAREIVLNWRSANQWAPRFWAYLEGAAMEAVEHPGRICQAGRVQYVYHRKLLRGTLLALLPCGRFIAYPHARFADVEKYDRVFRSLVFDHPNYGAVELTRTIAAENVTQAVAASILREALRMINPNVIVGHTHDEIMLEVEAVALDVAETTLEAVMTTPPLWATGLPLAAESAHGTRYKVKNP